MNKTIEGMARAVAAAWFGPAWIKHERQVTDEEIAVQKAALLWLAANVSDEMVEAASHFSRTNGWTLKDAISAALRAAGDGR